MILASSFRRSAPLSGSSYSDGNHGPPDLHTEELPSPNKSAMEKILDSVDPEMDMGIFIVSEAGGSKDDPRGWVLWGKHIVSERSWLR